MSGVHLITDDGQFEEDAYDLEQEQRAVLRVLAATTRGGASTSSDILQAELDDRVYATLRKRLNQEGDTNTVARRWSRTPRGRRPNCGG